MAASPYPSHDASRGSMPILGITLLVVLSACGSTRGAGAAGGVGTAGGGAEVSSRGETGSGGAAGESATPGNTAKECGVTAEQHGAACAGNCPITGYWEINCVDATHGLDVVATDSGLFIGAAKELETRLFGMSEGELQQLNDAALDHTGAPLVMAADPSGRLLLATNQVDRDTSQVTGVTLISGTVEGFEEQLLVGGVESSKYLELLVDGEGTPHVFHEGGNLSPLSVPARPDDTPKQSRVSLTDDGQVVMFAVRLEGDAGDRLYQLLATLGQDTVSLGPLGYVPRHNHGPFRAPRFRPLRAVVPKRGEVSPFYGAVLQHADALHVVGSSDGALFDVALPETALPEFECPEQSVSRDSCSLECLENKDSLEKQAFAAVRGPQDIWVAYAMGHFGARRYFAGSSDGTPICRIDREPKTTELFLIRVPLDGTAPSPVFSVPIEEGVHAPVEVSIDNDHGPIAIHQFGDQLGIAVASLGLVRVFRVDLSLLDP